MIPPKTSTVTVTITTSNSKKLEELTGYTNSLVQDKTKGYKVTIKYILTK